jgi:hypothetical protein
VEVFRQIKIMHIMKARKRLNFKIISLVLACLCCVDNELKEKAHKKADQVILDLHTEKAYTFFSDKFFSREHIELISRDLREKCDYENRSGKFVDYYYESMPGTDKVSFIYEYFLKCDSLRFILKYDLKPEPELIWFKLEGIGIKNPMIIDKTKQLQPM